MDKDGRVPSEPGSREPDLASRSGPPGFDPSRGVLGIDMRFIPKGCALDEFHFDMWAGLMSFLIGHKEARRAFTEATGMDFRAPRNAIEVAIDKATGHDGTEYVAAFCRWATPLYFGGDEDISPSIHDKLYRDSDGSPEGRDRNGLDGEAATARAGTASPEHHHAIPGEGDGG